MVKIKNSNYDGNMKTPASEKNIETKEVQIRTAQLKDTEEMVNLLKELFAVEKDFAFDEKKQRKGISLMVTNCQKHRCVKVAQIDGRVVGMCTAQTLVSTAEGSMVALIEDMVVSSKYRGMGIGRKLMAHIERWVKSREVTRLQLLADRTNFSALDFYDKMGWLPTSLIGLRKKWKQN